MARSTSGASSIGGIRPPIPVKTPVAARPPFPSPEKSITPGSRASKYVGVTARQLNARNTAASPARAPVPASPTRGSPTRALRSPTRNLSSPMRMPGSPMNTPKPLGRLSYGTPGTAKARASLGTPKARVAAASAMPPPPSPGLPALAGAGEETLLNRSVSQLEMDGRALQDKINRLVSGRMTPSSPSGAKPAFPRSQSLVGVMEQQAEIDRLQSRLDALEYENQRLLQSQDGGAAEEELERTKARLQTLESEREASHTRVVELEASLRTSERSLDENTSKIEGLERTVQTSVSDLEKAKTEGENRLKSLQSNLEDSEALVKSLKEAVEAKEGAAMENDAVLKAKDAEVAMLQTRLQKAQAELEEERKELGAEVDELRQAGQVSLLQTLTRYESALNHLRRKRSRCTRSASALPTASDTRWKTRSPCCKRRCA